MFVDLPQPLQDAFWATVTVLLVTYVPALVVFSASKVVQYAKELWASLKDQNEIAIYGIENAVGIAVRAAEQMGLTGQLVDFGLSKKEYAIEIAQKLLDKQGIKVDLQVIDAAVEAEVNKAFPKKVVG